MSTCQTCKGLHGYSALYISFPELQISAQRRVCTICRTLLDAVLQLTAPSQSPESIQAVLLNLLSQDEVRVDVLNVSSPFAERPTSTITVTHYDSFSHESNRDEYEIYRPLDSTEYPHPWGWVHARSSINSSTGSDESAMWALQRYWDCTEKHSSCNDSAGDPLLPTRVLDLGLSASGSDLLSADLKLHEKIGNEYAPYICLSHCWGSPTGPQPMTTTKKTLHGRKERICFTSLPKTFQDAVVFARKMHFRYLWIDSLCILQDDSRDWRVESARMQKIYSDASITIAATVATNSHEGFLKVATSSHLGYKSSIHTDEKSGVAQNLHFRQKIDHSGLFVAKNGQHYPLLQRGWVLQERYLSSRTLYFTDSELVWQCNDDLSCQCQNLAPCRLYWNSSWTRRGLIGGSSQAISNRWRSLVHEFTFLNLSKQRDRLPALEGLANLFLPRKMQYLAGIWSDSICSDLLWEVEGYIYPRPKTWRAPTWSWASIDGVIQYDPDVTKYILACSIMDTDCKYVQSDSLGEVSTGFIRVHGAVLKAEYHFRKTDRTHLIGIESEDGETDPQHYFSPDYKADFSRGWSEVAELKTLKRDLPVYCLHFANEETGSNSSKALVLSPLGDDTFERIGIHMFHREFFDLGQTRTIKIV